jgi:aldehyde:ferredoxin oxidoreductase
MKISQHGYAGRILTVDLSSRMTGELPTLDYAPGFVGGRGIAARLYWDRVPAAAQALKPDNALVFATGPLAGIPLIGGSRLVACGKSPALSPEYFTCTNLGGNLGLGLKSAGYDALFVQGKAERPIYLLIGDGRVEFKDASVLWGMGTIKTKEVLRREWGETAAVLTIGPAGENMAVMAVLSADNDATGSGGLGAVMGSKLLKAIVVRAALRRIEPADPERLQKLTSRFVGLGTEMMSVVGNMEFRITGPQTRKTPCHGCLGNCLRRTYEAKDGDRGKFMCQPATFYRPMAEGYYGPGLDVPFRAVRLCDDYGLDTMSISMMVLWLFRCLKAGILSDESTGMPLSKLGSLEFIESLVREISLREGFGDLLAQGLLKAADQVGPAARDQIGSFLSKAGQPNVVDPRLYITSELLHATEPRPAQAQLREISVVVTRWVAWLKHQENSYVSADVVRRIAQRFWGSDAAADLSTHDGKALAAKMIQDREYGKDCLVLCSFLWPVLDIANSDDHAGDPTLENQFLSAVTGREISEQELYRTGERVFDLQRAILVREGYRGKDEDRLPETWYTKPLRGDPTNPECLVPGKNGEVMSRRGAVVDRAEFERTRQEYYHLRCWDVATGLQSKARLEQLGLKDVAADLKLRDLASD